jgi:PucR C-terminal helix-turn-helix domain/GGDEF-like domain
VAMADDLPRRSHVASMCRASLRTLRSDARHAVARIRGDVPEYRAVDLREHEENVTQQLRTLLHGLADSSRPSETDLDLARELGGRRALQGLRLESVITAYHLGYQHLWARLLDRAKANGTDEELALLNVVDTIWTWVEIVSAAAADGYAAAMNQEQAQRIDAGHRLLESLYAGHAGQESTAVIARSIGFNPRATFCAISAPVGEDPGSMRAGLERAARRASVPAHVETREGAVVVLLQTSDPGSVLQALDSVGPGLGVSTTRPGLPGLAQCLRDADEAMALAVHTGAALVDYARQWWAVALNERREEIAPLLAAPLSESAQHLADAVTAFVDGGFSITSAGAALHVHPNTVKYRLDRWQTLTGWDVRTVDGLQRSLAYVALGPWERKA